MTAVKDTNSDQDLPKVYRTRAYKSAFWLAPRFLLAFVINVPTDASDQEELI